MTNVRWRIVTMLLVAATINYIDRVNLSYAAPTFMKQFGIGPAEMGVVLSAFLWTYFFVYGAAALLWGAATTLTATHDSAGLCLPRRRPRTHVYAPRGTATHASPAEGDPQVGHWPNPWIE